MRRLCRVTQITTEKCVRLLWKGRGGGLALASPTVSFVGFLLLFCLKLSAAVRWDNGEAGQGFGQMWLVNSDANMSAICRQL